MKFILISALIFLQKTRWRYYFEQKLESVLRAMRAQNEQLAANPMGTSSARTNTESVSVPSVFCAGSVSG